MLSRASLRRVAEWSEIASDVDDPLEKLSLLLGHAIEDRVRCILWRATTSVASRNEQYVPDVGRIYDAWRHKLADVLEAGRTAGIFRPTGPVDEIVNVIICAIDGLMTGVARELDGYTPERNPPAEESCRVASHGSAHFSGAVRSNSNGYARAGQTRSSPARPAPAAHHRVPELAQDCC